MSTATLARDVLRPRAPGGGGPGFALSLLVHVGLIVALAFGVHWRASEPVGVSAELWSAVPQFAAPKAEAPPTPQPEVKPAPPPPAPKVDTQQRDAQIAIEKRQERERQLKREAEEKAQREKAEREKAARDKAEAQRKQKEEELRLAKLREDQLKRMQQGLAGATGAATSTGTAARDAGPSSSYAGRVIARVYPNIVLLDPVAGDPVAEVEVRAAPDGTIIGRRIVKASGVKEWDDAVLRAIDRTQVLPRDVDGRVPSPLLLVFNPRK